MVHVGFEVIIFLPVPNVSLLTPVRVTVENHRVIEVIET